jgi:crotonobetainyl-CoA:carnitine CoA-transferase CaiB-like acyl-CoA transferase
MDSLPLSGVRVVEMSHMVMGPTCGMVLSSLGAEVIKVEPFEGDRTRTLGGMGISFFPLFNRGKKSVSLDLKSPEGREAMDRLLATADVFIENFRDDTIARLGLDAATLAKKHPRLIVGAHKGFLSGPYEHRPALDEVVQMMAGLAYMTGSRERPLRVGSSINDIMGGMFGAIGVLAALLQRKETGEGEEIRVGLFENCLFSVAQHMVQFQQTGVPAPPMSQRVHAWPVYDIFDTADGKRLFVAATTHGHWKALCEAFDLKELLADPRLTTTTERIEARDRVLPLIAERFARVPMAELEAKLEGLELPFARINAPEELFDDPHAAGGLIDLIDVDGRRHRTPSLPLEIDGVRPSPGLAAPQLGEHTEALLRELGYSDAEIAARVRPALRAAE